MQVYLPIAQISVDVFVISGLGLIAGFLSGLFGVGGAFLTTPVLIFLGIPAPVAVASQANQLVGASVSGVIAHWRRGNVDVRMGMILVAGGLLGSMLGVAAFRALRAIGQLDFAISILFVTLLGGIGGLMLVESLRELVRSRRPQARPRARAHRHIWLHQLPLRLRFPRSKLYISAVGPFLIGMAAGLLTAILGVGGGFFLIPAMIYLLGMPGAVVVGTSLFQLIFTAAATTVLQAVTNQTVDVMLALLLLAGGVIGAQFGSAASTRLRGAAARLTLACLILAVSGKLIADLVTPPDNPYSLLLGGG